MGFVDRGLLLVPESYDACQLGISALYDIFGGPLQGIGQVGPRLVSEWSSKPYRLAMPLKETSGKRGLFGEADGLPPLKLLVYFFLAAIAPWMPGGLDVAIPQSSAD